jgi:hypothetical protein
LRLWDVCIHSSQLFGLISAAPTLEFLDDSPIFVLEGEKFEVGALSSLDWKNLTTYETNLGIAGAAIHFFPLTVTPILPSLSRLSLWSIEPSSMNLANHILNAASRSLEFLLLEFQRSPDEPQGMCSS